ncbi:MAG TPA: dihydroorotase [Elusimicrobia bacterium]|nr:dihydroorotase [Elusimicrobiota bacterium]
MRLLIEGGLVVDPEQSLDEVRDLLLEDGKVKDCARGLGSRPGLKGVERLDARGLWVLPGLIDLHVHLREPAFGRGTQDESIASGTRAAAAGGVTTLVAMPNTRPPVDTPKALRALQTKARNAPIHALFAACVTRGQKGRELTDFKALAGAGAAAFSDDGRPVRNSELLRRALLATKRLGLPLLDHAEDEGFSAASEVLAVSRDLALAAMTGGRLHLCHVSCAATVELLREAKRRGADVTAEAAPHHFTLTAGDIPRSRRAADFKMKPPLRRPEDREALIAGLAEGTIDAIATDHAPHAPAKKRRGLSRAPFGIIGLETLVPLSLALVRSGRLTRLELARRLSYAPARILGLRSKGHLRRGADADAVLIDPRARWRFDDPVSKSRNSPFLGRALVGRARAAVVSGRVVFLRKGGKP